MSERVSAKQTYALDLRPITDDESVFRELLKHIQSAIQDAALRETVSIDVSSLKKETPSNDLQTTQTNPEKSSDAAVDEIKEQTVREVLRLVITHTGEQTGETVLAEDFIWSKGESIRYGTFGEIFKAVREKLQIALAANDPQNLGEVWYPLPDNCYQIDSDMLKIVQRVDGHAYQEINYASHPDPVDKKITEKDRGKIEVWARDYDVYMNMMGRKACIIYLVPKGTDLSLYKDEEPKSSFYFEPNVSEWVATIDETEEFAQTEIYNFLLAQNLEGMHVFVQGMDYLADHGISSEAKPVGNFPRSSTESVEDYKENLLKAIRELLTERGEISVFVGRSGVRVYDPNTVED